MNYQERFIDIDTKGSYCFLDLTEINKLFVEVDERIEKLEDIIKNQNIQLNELVRENRQLRRICPKNRPLLMQGVKPRK